MNECIIHLLLEGLSFSIDLCADKEYSFQVTITNAAGRFTTAQINFSKYFIYTQEKCVFILPVSLPATYDVQRARTVATGSNEISVTGEFVSNSAAKGVFIVLQSVDGSSPDVFRAVLRPESGMTLTDVITAVPPSTYLPAFYDLEEDGLPNSSPAVEQNNTGIVEGGGENYVFFSFINNVIFLYMQIQTLMQQYLSTLREPVYHI